MEKLAISASEFQMDYSFWKNKRILITGHTGFKGSWLTIWLNKLGCNVTGLSLEPEIVPSLFSSANVFDLCNSLICDVRDLAKLQSLINAAKPDIIFHLAAQALVLKSYIDPIKTFEVNCLGTANLLEAARHCDSVSGIVLVTSDKVYLNNESNLPFVENDRLGGYDPYSASKAASEIIIESYRSSFFKGKFTKLVVARAGNVIGGGDWASDRLIPDAIRAWTKGEILEIRNPESVRPWQHVLDSLRSYITLARKLVICSKVSNEYNFGPNSEDISSVRDVISNAQKFWSNAKVKINCNIPALKEANTLLLNSTKAKEELLISPVWNLQESIEKTIDWYLKDFSGEKPIELCLADIDKFEKKMKNHDEN